MSTKPTSLPIWATDTAAEVTEPNPAKKQQGHVGGEPVFADYENWYKRLVYLWTEYLRDGALFGDHTIDGGLEVSGRLGAHGAVVESGIETLVMVAAVPVHNHPLGARTAILRVDAAAGADDLTGIAGGVDGRRVEIWNIDPTNAVDLVNESANSLAANRFITPNGANLILAPRQCAIARYFSADSRWRLTNAL